MGAAIETVGNGHSTGKSWRSRGSGIDDTKKSDRRGSGVTR